MLRRMYMWSGGSELMANLDSNWSAPFFRYGTQPSWTVLEKTER